MKFTLKRDYQTNAVGDALARLQMAREDWHGKNSRKSAFSLTAVTGAGKTVMAAAVFESLFHGDDELDFDADPGAVVIWFSDDPALNEQTRWDVFEALPSQTRPQRGAKPAKRLTALAHELASDDILPGAGKLAHAEMHKALDDFQESEKAKIEAKRKAVLTVDGKTVVADLKSKNKSFDDFWEDADMAAIEDAYRRAARIFSPDISRTYADHLAYKVARPDEPDEFEEAIIEGRVSIAALGLVTEVQSYFDAEADKLAKAWFAKYANEIKKLTDDRKEAYRQIVEMSTEPQDVALVKPEAKFEPTSLRKNNEEMELPTYKNHLLCDENGNYPEELNDWEMAVIERETKRKGFSFWYRNPQLPGHLRLASPTVTERNTKWSAQTSSFSPRWMMERWSLTSLTLMDPNLLMRCPSSEVWRCTRKRTQWLTGGSSPLL
jgi:hypothetical protein